LFSFFKYKDPLRTKRLHTWEAEFLWLFRFNDRWFGAFVEGVDFLSVFGLAVIALRAASGAWNGDGVAL